jgi:hypothetical protein
MHHNGTSVLDRPEAATSSPLIAGPRWFECGEDDRDPRTLTLRMGLPVSADLMVAALYADKNLSVRDLDTDDEGVWALVAVIIAQDGLNAIERTRDAIAKTRRRGGWQALDRPVWFQNCRQRVTELTGGAA